MTDLEQPAGDKRKRTSAFNPATFLGRPGDGRSIIKYRKHGIAFS